MPNCRGWGVGRRVAVVGGIANFGKKTSGLFNYNDLNVNENDLNVATHSQKS